MQEIITPESPSSTGRRTSGERSAFPLSYAQQRLWFMDQLEPGNAAYNIPGSVRLKGQLNTAALQQALSEIVRRHEALRTCFPIVNGQPVQSILPAQQVVLRRRDLRDLPESEREPRAQQLMREEAVEPFNLTTGPLLRTQLLQLQDAEYILLPTMHHIVSDGWSLSVFLNELTVLYRAFAKGEESPLPELEVQYADYAGWQREYLQGEVMEQQLSYWRKQLAGAPPALELQTDRPRPAFQSMRGSSYRHAFPRELLENLYLFSRANGVTPFMTLLAAFKVLLARYSGQTDIVVGSPIAGRTQKETEPIIGNFLNTLVLRTDLSGEPTFVELAKRVREMTLEAFSYQDVPFEKLVEELQPVRDLSRSPFFQVMFILLNHPELKCDLPGLTLEATSTSNETAKFDLTLTMMEIEKGLKIDLEYNTELFDLSTMERFLSQYERLLESICVDGTQSIDRIPILSNDERFEMFAVNDLTKQEYPRQTLTHQLIEKKAQQNPSSIAVTCGNEQLTYKDLNDRANQLSGYLRSLGVGPDALVGVMMDRSVNMVVALLGIMKAGGAYVPLDPGFPTDRLRFMIEDSELGVLISDSEILQSIPAALTEQLASQQATVVSFDDDWGKIAVFATDDQPPNAKPNNLAYVIYTSGSTGRPKGVMLEHQSLVNFLCSMASEPGMTADDALVAVTTLSFDISGLELYLPLITGARVVVARREEVMDPSALQELLKSSQATVMQATPATWRMLIDAGWSGNKGLKVLCGGEALPRDLADQLIERTKELWNMYGPTETTIWSSVEQVRKDGGINLGHPIANTSFYVLDAYGEPSPFGVAGELYIGGEGLARGYFKREELTRERFLTNPFDDAPNARMYRTGDRVRRRSDGSLEYLGRTDHQVKIRGYRIETGEIETVLGEHPVVAQAVVIARDDASGDKRLVAYIVPTVTDRATNGAGNDAIPSITEWRDYLRQRLPEYMVPATFVTLESLPFTPNGKIDRKRLPVPDDQRPQLSSDYVAPQNAAEEAIASVWQEALRINKVGRYDNFFDLGGHSLLMAQVHARLQSEFKREVSMLDLFRYPTINSLANFLGQEQTDEKQVEQAVVRASMRLNAVRRPRLVRN